jgi:hypothetical protein
MFLLLFDCFSFGKGRRRLFPCDGVPRTLSSTKRNGLVREGGGGGGGGGVLVGLVCDRFCSVQQYEDLCEVYA